MGEQGLESQLISPPGALRRLRHETFTDSQRIYRAALPVIDFVETGLRGVGSERGRGTFILESPTGASVRYDGYTADLGASRTVTAVLPIAGGREEYVLDYERSGDYGSDHATGVRITRTVFHGNRSEKELGVVFGSERDYDAYKERDGSKKTTRFSTGDERGFSKLSSSYTRHPSVVDPRAILGKLRKVFPQL